MKSCLLKLSQVRDPSHVITIYEDPMSMLLFLIKKSPGWCIEP